MNKSREQKYCNVVTTLKSTSPTNQWRFCKNYRSRECAATHPMGQKKCGMWHTHR